MSVPESVRCGRKQLALPAGAVQPPAPCYGTKPVGLTSG